MIFGWWKDENKMNNDPKKTEQIKEFKKQIDKD